jgi:broad specificity phosphatase PhoE
VRTVVHLVRHGEVHNPAGLLYGRLPEYYLSEVGEQMALRVAEHLRDGDVTHLRCSPLERAQQTMDPIAEFFGLPVVTDGRVIEADNFLEGRKVDRRTWLRSPRTLWLFRNPLRPSWGEPYAEVVARMRLAMRDAAAAAAGHEAVIVSHQLPIWAARSDAEGRRLAHDPRKRQCALASVTSFTYLGGRVTKVGYAEPADDLLRKATSTKFVAGA